MPTAVHALLPDTPHAAMYAAMCAHDARFDGRFFVGVTSTGVYCRPVCRVRTPRLANCRFFGNAPSAEAAGFRPCLRCRPELAPGLSLVDSSQSLAEAAARLLDAAVHSGQELSLPQLAARLGVTDRHLRRVFQAAHGVAPLDYITTRRLLLAKQLLTDTSLPVTEVAHASGFGSLRRFNAAFAGRYRMSPSTLRRGVAEGTPRRAPTHSESVTLRLPYRPPYDLAGTLRFLQARALPGVEQVVEEVQGPLWRRTLALQQAGTRHIGWIECQFESEQHRITARIAPNLLPVLGRVLQGLRQTLDLDADPERIDPVLATMPLPPVPGLRVISGPCPFEIAARVVLGQQVTVAAARTLTLRLVSALGEALPEGSTPWPSLNRLFPSAKAVAQADPEQLGKLGIVRQRVKALQAVAQALATNQLELHRGAPLEATLAALRELPGIGEWSTQLIALRALAWPDAFPATDIGVLNGMQAACGVRDVAAVQALAEAWRPWRAYAVMRLWQSLELAA